MASDVELEGVAGLLAVHFPVDDSVDDIPEGEIRCNWIECEFALEEDEDDQWRGLFAKHQAEQLAAAGFGHIPTALHQAADDLFGDFYDERRAELAKPYSKPMFPEQWSELDGIEAASRRIRARAERAGGTA